MSTAPKTVKTYTLNGSLKDFTIPFEYLARKFVSVTLIGATRVELVLNVGFRFSTPTQITTIRGSAWGPADNFDLIEIRRMTSATERLVDFADGSILRAYDLNTSQVQSLHIAEEARDLTADTIGVNNDGNLDARARRIVNLADPIDPGDAVTLRMNQQWAGSALNQATASAASATASQTSRLASEAARNAAQAAQAAAEAARDTANTHKDAAAASAATATTQASLATTNGATQVTLAAAQVTLATTQANASGTQATNSLNSANASQTSRLASEAARDLALAYRDSALGYRDQAQGWAAGVNMPSAVGQGSKMLRQKADATGFEYINSYSDYGLGGTCQWIGTGDTTTVRGNGLYSVDTAVTGQPIANVGGTLLVMYSASNTGYGTLHFTTWTNRKYVRTKNNGVWSGWVESLADGLGGFAPGGLVEIGRYLDFHFNATVQDFSARIAVDSTNQLGIDATSIVTRGNSLLVGMADADTAALFRQGRLDWVNNANSAWKAGVYRATTHNFQTTAGAAAASVDASGNFWASGELRSEWSNIVSVRGNVYTSSLFINSGTNGKLGLTTGNTFDLHWNAGFYYRIDGNTYTLINSSPSDRSLKNVNHRTEAEEAGVLIDQLAELSVNYSFKAGAPIKCPVGDRYGFIAQEATDVMPTLFQETGVPGGNEDSTIMTFSEDAQYQLISLLVKTVGDLRARVAALESK
jgi:hypothetical protein